MFKKQTKKLFSVVLSFCLVVSMLVAYAPVDVNAEESTAALKFCADDLSNGKIFVQIGSDARVQLDSSEADSGGTIWRHDIAAKEQTVIVTAEPDDGYGIDDIAVFEGEDRTSAAFGGNFDSENGSYSFPLQAKTYVIKVNFVEVGAGSPGGEPGGSGTPETGQTASLKFSASDLSDFKLTYKIDHAVGAVIPAEDKTPYGVVTEVDGDKADDSGAIWIRDFLSGGQITITAELKDGVEGKLSDKISNIYANEGEEGRSPAYNGFFSFNEDGSKATYSFEVSAMTYEVRVDGGGPGGESGGPGGEPGGDSGGPGGEPGGDSGPRPEHYGKNSYISISTHNEVAGDLYYAFADSAEEISEEDWNPLSVEGNFYEPIDMSLAGTATKMFLRIDGKDGKHLDADGELIIAKDEGTGPERIYRIGGTYNNDPNYDEQRDGKQLDGIGLSDLYNNRDDNYIIPFEFKDYAADAIFMEFHWVDVTTIDVKVDAASQYLLASGKAEIGIATGKGFKTKVDDEAHVSIPVLEDCDMGGEQERYLVDIKIKREYFVPEFTFNGHTYETFEAGNIDGTSAGTDEYAYIATAIPAENFKQIMEETGGSLEIHLTVDKQVGVVDSQGNENEIQAAFRMIDDGNIPETTSMAELDADMQLEADSSDISTEERAAGYLDSYDITMELDGTNATEFPVAINILIPGDYSDNSELVVVREHEGEAPEELGCAVEDGNVIFQTAKFSRFTVKDAHVHSGTKVNQIDATCTEYGVNAYYKCSCGRYYTDSACTKEIADLDAWKTGDGKIAKRNHDFSESEYQNDGEGKHYRICALCTTESEHESCSGGTATCQKKAVCSLCKTVYGELAEHTWDAGEITKAATCKDKGVKTFKCTVEGCTGTKTEEIAIDANNHVNTEVLNAKDATCTEKGYTGDTHCKDCDTTVTGTDIAAIGHDMTKTVSAKVPATCEKDGKEAVMGCKNCDHTEGGAVIKATSHKWDSGKVTKEPTVSAEGVKTFTCVNSGCNETKTEAVAKLPEPKKNEVIEDKTGNDYKVTDPEKKEVSYKAPASKKAKTVTIPASVTIDGVTYKVTKIDDNAFNGCKKMKTITIKSTKLTSKSVSANAFKGLSKNVIIKVPKKQLKAYKKLLKKKGFKGKVKA